MGRSYEQLSLRERVLIELRRGQGWSMRQIGVEVGRSAATVSRELRRNGRPTKQWRASYDGERAHALALRRRRWDARFKLARQPDLQKLVRDGLAMGRSPEQIAGRLEHDHGRTVISPESIYRFIYHRSAQ
jgi:IS30 family transposase